MATFAGDDDGESDLDVNSHPTLITPIPVAPASSAATPYNNTVLPAGRAASRRSSDDGGDGRRDGGSGGSGGASSGSGGSGGGRGGGSGGASGGGGGRSGAAEGGRIGGAGGSDGGSGGSGSVRRRGPGDSGRSGDTSGGRGGGRGGNGRLTPSPIGRAIVPVALAVVSVVALIAAWTHLEARTDTAVSPGTSTAGSPSAPSVPAVAATATPSATSGSPSSSGASASPGSPSGSASGASGSPTKAATASASPSATKSSQQPGVLLVDRSVPVIVLNATSRAGLAAKVAAKLRADGWQVISIGNWTGGGITQTTAYLIGHVHAQATMQSDIKTATIVNALLPGMRPKTMTLVIGPDYPR